MIHEVQLAIEREVKQDWFMAAHYWGRAREQSESQNAREFFFRRAAKCKRIENQQKNTF